MNYDLIMIILIFVFDWSFESWVC